MEAWIVIDFLNSTVEKCDSEKAAFKLVREWFDDGAELDEVKVYKVMEEYSVNVEFHLVPAKPAEKPKKKK